MKENSSIVNNPHFETGIVRVQQGVRLSPQEEEAVKRFKKTADGATVVVQSHADKYKKQKTSDYISTEHVLCDSNICERSNSRARLFMHYLRAQHMAPESLELLLFLFCNREYWNYSKIIDEAIHWDVAWKEERRRELPKKQQRLPLVQQMMTPKMTHRWLRAERPAES